MFLDSAQVFQDIVREAEGGEGREMERKKQMEKKMEKVKELERDKETVREMEEEKGKEMKKELCLLWLVVVVVVEEWRR